MPKYSLPSIRSKIPEDLRKFTDRVREAFDDIAAKESSDLLIEDTPGVCVGFFHIASCAVTTDYTVGNILPEASDRRVRVMLTCGATATTLQLTHDGNTYSYALSARETLSVTVTGIRGIAQPYLVQSNTGSIDFSVHLFIPTATKLA